MRARRPPPAWPWHGPGRVPGRRVGAAARSRSSSISRATISRTWSAARLGVDGVCARRELAERLGSERRPRWGAQTEERVEVELWSAALPLRRSGAKNCRRRAAKGGSSVRSVRGRGGRFGPTGTVKYSTRERSGAAVADSYFGVLYLPREASPVLKYHRTTVQY